MHSILGVREAFVFVLGQMLTCNGSGEDCEELPGSCRLLTLLSSLGAWKRKKRERENQNHGQFCSSNFHLAPFSRTSSHKDQVLEWQPQNHVLEWPLTIFWELWRQMLRNAKNYLGDQSPLLGQLLIGGEEQLLLIVAAKVYFRILFCINHSLYPEYPFCWKHRRAIHFQYLLDLKIWVRCFQQKGQLSQHACLRP